MRTRLTERDLTRIVRRVINEQSRIQSDQDVDAFIKELGNIYSKEAILDLVKILSNDLQRELLILHLKRKTEEM